GTVAAGGARSGVLLQCEVGGSAGSAGRRGSYHRCNHRPQPAAALSLVPPAPLPLRGQRAPSLTGARSPRLRRRRGHSLTCPLPLVLVHPHIAPPEQVHGPPPELGPRTQGRPGCAAGALKKRGDDLLEKDILVQENRAFGYLPP